MEYFSLLPLDVGFDPRAHDMPVVLPNTDFLEVAYLDAQGREKRVLGGQGLVRRRLLEAGYRLKP